MLFLPECFSFIGTNLFDALEVRACVCYVLCLSRRYRTRLLVGVGQWSSWLLLHASWWMGLDLLKEGLAVALPLHPLGRLIPLSPSFCHPPPAFAPPRPLGVCPPPDTRGMTQVAEPLDGPIMSRYRELARSHGLWLSLGGFQVPPLPPRHRRRTLQTRTPNSWRLALLKARHARRRCV